MNVFGAYAEYYDLLYRDKDYGSEAEYIHGLIRKYQPAARQVLNLGCGTGMHDGFLAKLGYSITGVDQSEEMLSRARKRMAELPPDVGRRLKFVQGDVRNLSLGGSFDTVISLFHVMSYLTANDDLRGAIRTAHAHLKPGGSFIFDCWYGPGVLSDPPVVRIKRLENENISVIRIAEPTVNPNQNSVDVDYTVLITNKADGKVEAVHENHKMRYLFTPEVDAFLNDAGFELHGYEEFMTGRALDFRSWNAIYIALKK